MKRIMFTLLGAFAIAGPALAGEFRIEQMEPAFWWSGMQYPRLQLMVHGAGIAALHPSLAYPGVRIASVTRTANPNYLFIDLAISNDARAGEFDIGFALPGKAPELNYRYRFLQRQPGSAQRKGFGPEDVIYNLMPDR